MKKSKAIAYFGNAVNLAKKLGINPSAVYQWPEQIPQRRAYEIEKLTKGELKAEFSQSV